MIDHVLGRPSAKSRRLQVLAVLSFWIAYLYRGDKHGPPFVRKLSKLATHRTTSWQVVALTMIYLYAARNFSTLLGIAGPDPLANMYTPAYFRATWVLTALDAGFWTAMRIRRKWLRDIGSVVFSLFYLVAAEQADAKVRKVRSMLTVDHLRVSWNKGLTPYLGFVQNLMRPRFMKWPPRELRIKRLSSSRYQEPVVAWLYWDGAIDELKACNKLILDIPGGGFVAMNPRTNDDKLLCWAARTRIPVLSLDYRKAPEYPYPYALNECFDVYASIIATCGRCVGLSGNTQPHVIVTGDSAGGNLATATILMVAEAGSTASRRLQGQVKLPMPTALILFYPSLDVNIGNWMSDEQMALIKDRRDRRTNRPIMRTKSAQYLDLVGTPQPREWPDEESGNGDAIRTALKEAERLMGEAESQQKKGNGKGSQEKEYLDGLSPRAEYSHAMRENLSGCTTPSRPRGREGLGTAMSPNIAISSGANDGSLAPAPATRLAMSSMISYFNDRVLTPEMMRAMIILYIGPHNRPDFSTDYLLSPVLAPDALLAEFPKTIILTGERDPLVDDTVIFAGRLKKVKREQHWQQWQQQRRQRRRQRNLSGRRAATTTTNNPRTPGTVDEYDNDNDEAQPQNMDSDTDSSDYEDHFDAKDFVEVVLLPGISHGFLQFPTVFAPSWNIFNRSAAWMVDLFREEEIRIHAAVPTNVNNTSTTAGSNILFRKSGSGGLVSGEGSQTSASVQEAEPTAVLQDSAETPAQQRMVDANNKIGSPSSSTSQDGLGNLEAQHQRVPVKVSTSLPVSALKSNFSLSPMPSPVFPMSSAAEPGRNGMLKCETNNDDNDNDNDNDNENDKGQAATADKKKKARVHGPRDLDRLRSSDDLLGRRMQGLAGGLTRRVELEDE